MGNIVSLSGGKDSTAMLLLMLEKGEEITEVFFFDSGWEFPQVFKHIEQIEKDTGIKVTRVKPDHNFDWYLFEKPLTRGKRKGEKGYGFPRPNARWCTEIKTRTIDKHAKGLNGVQCVGIAAGEDRPLREGVRYPLIEYGYTEADCLEYCYSKGYDFGGLYEYLDRVSCWCCPMKNMRELKQIMLHNPELWEELKEMERKSWNTLRNDNWSVQKLEERFKLEDSQLSLFEVG